MYKIYKNFAEAVRRLYPIGITISESGLRGIVRRLNKTGSVQERRRSNRPRATRRDEDSYLRRTARRCRTKTLAELAQAGKGPIGCTCIFLYHFEVGRSGIITAGCVKTTTFYSSPKCLKTRLCKQIYNFKNNILVKGYF